MSSFGELVEPETGIIAQSPQISCNCGDVWMFGRDGALGASHDESYFFDPATMDSHMRGGGAHMPDDAKTALYAARE